MQIRLKQDHRVHLKYKESVPPPPQNPEFNVYQLLKEGYRLIFLFFHIIKVPLGIIYGGKIVETGRFKKRPSLQFWVVFRSKRPVSTIFPPYIMKE